MTYSQPYLHDEILDRSHESEEETFHISRTEEMLDKFFKWLTGVDEGRREQKTTKQYLDEVRRIAKKVDPAYHRVNSLAFTRLICDKWPDPLEK